MKSWKPLHVMGLAALAVLGGCASFPTGPSAMALPGTGKTFEQFRMDDGDCQQYAFQQIGGMTAEKAQEESAVRSAIIGTAIGAIAGAAIGGHDGAAVGAGTGLLFGSTAGADAGRRSAYGSQRRYDNAYIQCMYARGHKVPVPAATAGMMREPAPVSPPVDAEAIPEPPQGDPPPPPPA